MHWKRIFTFVAIGGGLAALATSATTARRRVVTIPPETAEMKATEARGAALDAEIQRLRERLHPTAVPQRPPRDLFSFERRSAALPATAAAPAPIAPVEAPVLPAPPALTLIGLAEDQDDDGRVVRMAIISGDRELFMVKEGQPVTARFKVGKISGETVELVDVNDNTILRLALK